MGINELNDDLFAFTRYERDWWRGKSMKRARLRPSKALELFLSSNVYICSYRLWTTRKWYTRNGANTYRDNI